MTTLETSSVCLLGPPIPHRESLTAMLRGSVRRVTWIPDSISFKKERGDPECGRLGRVQAQVAGTRDAQYLELLRETIGGADSQIVIAFWGTMPLPDLLALRRLRPNAKLVLMVLCHPMALSTIGIWRQNLLMRRIGRALDGFVFPSRAMAEYFAARVFVANAPAIEVVPPCWPGDFQATSAQPAGLQRPNLVFVGRTDLSSHTFQISDDLRPLMRRILGAGIELHHGYSSETDSGHPLLKPFLPIPLPQLIPQLARHDASLVAYNTSACARKDRFLLTVPDRLITSVAAGVPVAIPRQGYTASKEYLGAYKAVIEFDSVTDLTRALDDRDRVVRLRGAAWEARGAYTAEARGFTLQSFLARLLSG